MGQKKDEKIRRAKEKEIAEVLKSGDVRGISLTEVAYGNTFNTRLHSTVREDI